MLKRRKLAVIFIILAHSAPLFLFAAYNSGDCRDAEPVCSDFISQPIPNIGPGEISDEIDIQNSCLDLENNSKWYLINVNSGGDLGFIIEPFSAADDYDWALYNITNASCGDIFFNPALEVSCNFSNSDLFPAENGKTGANGATSNNTAGQSDSPYNAMISASQGEQYVLIIQTFDILPPDSGYTIDFSISSADITNPPPPEITKIFTECGAGYIDVYFNIYIDCLSIDTESFSISGPGGIIEAESFIADNCSRGGAYDGKIRFFLAERLSEPGNYTVTIDNLRGACGNTPPSALTGEFSIQGLGVTAAADNTEPCPGEITQLSVQADGSPPFQYEWSGAGSLSCTDCASPTARLLQSGKIIVKVTDNNFCSGYDTLDFQAKPGPLIKIISGDTSLCSGGAAQLKIEVTGSGDYSVNWSPADGLSSVNSLSPEASPESSTTYTVTISDSQAGCEMSEEIAVRIIDSLRPEIISASGSFLFCEGVSLTLDAGQFGPQTGEEYESYQWYLNGAILNDSVSRFIAAEDEGYYKVEVAGVNGCAGSAGVDVSHFPKPEISKEFPGQTCEGEVINILISPPDKQNYKILWLNTTGFLSPANSFEPEIEISGQGKIEFPYIIDDLLIGCSYRDTIVINSNPPIEVSFEGPIKACPGQGAYIKALISGGSGNIDYYWDSKYPLEFPEPSDSSIAFITPPADTKVTLTARGGDGCEATAEALVTVPQPKAALKIADLEHTPKERGVPIKVIFESENDLLACSPKYLDLKIEWPLTAFNPSRIVASGVDITGPSNRFRDEIKGAWIINARIEKDLIPQPGNAILDIYGDVMLGNSDNYEITITEADWGGIDSDNTLKPGILLIKDICIIDGEKRLLNYSGLPGGMKIFPNPASELLTISYSADEKIEIYRMAISPLSAGGGKIEKDFSTAAKSSNMRSDIKIDISGLPSGPYTISFITAKGVFREKFIIIK